MAALRRGRLGAIAALSLALHAAVLLWLAWPQAPDLFANGPDLSSMTVELTAPAAPERPLPARSPEPSSASPSISSPSRTIESLAQPAAPIPEGVAPVSAPPAAASGPGNLQAALRSGAGCARLAFRSREEREACEERLGRLGGSGRTYDAPMEPGKRAYYDEVAAAGPSGRSYGDPQPAAVSPGGAAYFRGVNCSIKFGAGRRDKGRQGEVRLGKSPCYIPLQGSFFTPEASVHKR